MAITLSGAAAQLYTLRDEEILLEGPAGCGKTVGALKKMVDACFQYPESQHLLCRDTRESMTGTILVTLESILGPINEVTRVKRSQRKEYRLGQSEIVCAGLDNPERAFGSGFGIVVVEEAREIAEESWELFGRAARDPKVRRAGDGAPFPYHQRIAVTNPGPPSHWLNRRATPCPDKIRRVENYGDLARTHAYNRGHQAGKMRRLVAVHQDNPRYFNPDSWRWTEDGARYLKTLEASMTGPRLAWMRYGLWAAAEGSVFGGYFTREKNVVKPFPIPSYWPVYFYLDPGRDHPCGAFWLAISPTQKHYVVAEIHETGLDFDKTAEKIKAIEERSGLHPVARFMDPRMGFAETYYAKHGRTIAEEFKDLGMIFDPWPYLQKASKVAAVDATCRAFLNGELFIFDGCNGAVGEVESWSYRRLRGGIIPTGDDQYEDKNNDIIDGLVASTVSGHVYREYSSAAPIWTPDQPDIWDPTRSTTGERELH
jgi:hypothetical protein